MDTFLPGKAAGRLYQVYVAVPCANAVRFASPTASTAGPAHAAPSRAVTADRNGEEVARG
jgi:hypothetical protein